MSEKKNIHRFGNIIVEYFPADKDTVACYQLRDISNDRRCIVTGKQIGRAHV